MKKPALPEDEESRLAALDGLNIVFSPAEERFDRITRLARRMFDVPIALVTLVASDIQWFKSSQGLTVTETPREVSFCGHAILMDQPLVISDTMRNPDFADNPLVTGEPYIRFYAGQAVQFAGKKIGTLCAIDTRPRAFLPSDLDSLRSLAVWVESELQLSALGEERKELIVKYDEMRRKVLIDPLTNCWNRQGIEEVLSLIFSRAERTRATVTIMMIGPDNFQDSSDSHLHKAGDFFLKEVAQRIRVSIRTHDVIARYDRDKFLVLLVDCDKGTARTIAQRILRDVAIDPILVRDSRISSTLSIGMACNEGREQWDWGRLIRVADTALQQVRIHGGNRSLFGRYD